MSKKVKGPEYVEEERVNSIVSSRISEHATTSTLGSAVMLVIAVLIGFAVIWMCGKDSKAVEKRMESAIAKVSNLVAEHEYDLQNQAMVNKGFQDDITFLTAKIKKQTDRIVCLEKQVDLLRVTITGGVGGCDEKQKKQSK